MKVIAIAAVFCCVALLPSIIHGDDDETNFQDFVHLLNQTAARGARGKLLKGIFRLSKNGYLGRGGFGLTYKAKFEGRIDHNGKEVAIKFTPIADKMEAFREYEIYTYLGAIDNPVAESFGIPAIYYFDRFRGYIMMAMTLLQPTFNQKCNKHALLLNDILITFREFAKTTKYIHLCGIRHDDIKSQNIMYNKQRLFIIDYNLAQKMDTIGHGGTTPFLPRRAHLGEIRCAKDDWESFFYSMCDMIGLNLPWFNIDDPRTIYELKKNTTNTLETIKQIKYVSKPLRNVMYTFGEYVLNDDKGLPGGYPNYNKFYQYIEKQMEKNEIAQPALVSWLTLEERALALDELANDPTMSISQIPKPGPRSEYPAVNRRYFREKYGAADDASVSGVTKKLERLDTFASHDD